MISIHQSEIKAWLDCRMKRHYRYKEKIERKKRPSPLIRGTIIHKMVELAHHGKDPFDALKAAEKEYSKLFREEKEEYGDLPGDIRRLMTSYFSWYASDPIRPMKVQGELAVEMKFKVDLMPGVILEGRIDKLGKSKDGRSWLEDTKSHKTLPEGDINYTDIQTVLYHWSLNEQYKIKTDGIAWNYIRYKAPAIPELLKSGELTRRNIDTTWPVYAQEIKRHKLDPADYKDMKEQLEGREATFFVRAYLPVSDTIVKNILNTTRQTVQEIIQERKPLRNIGQHCKWCEYYNLCSAELRGLDVEFMRKHDYQEKKDEEETVEAD